MSGFTDILSAQRIDIARGLVPNASHIDKFGINKEVDNTDPPVAVWEQDTVYVFSDVAPIDTISSSNAGDTQDVLITGLRFGTWKEETQVVTLNGQNKVPLDFGLIRINRMENDNASLIQGVVRAYEDTAITAGVPNDNTKNRGIITAEHQQTQQAVYSVPAGKIAYLKAYFIGCGRTPGTTSGTKEADVILKERDFGKAFKAKKHLIVDNSGTSVYRHVYETPPRFDEKSDLMWEVEAVTANNTAVFAGFDIELYDKI